MSTVAGRLERRKSRRARMAARHDISHAKADLVHAVARFVKRTGLGALAVQTITAAIVADTERQADLLVTMGGGSARRYGR